MDDDILPDVPFPSTPTSASTQVPGSTQETPQGQFQQLSCPWPPNPSGAPFYNLGQHPLSAPAMLQMLPNQYTMMHGSPGTPMLVPSSQFPNITPGYQYLSPNVPFSQLSAIEPSLQVASTEDGSEVSSRGGRGGRACGAGTGRGRGRGKGKGATNNGASKEPKTMKPWDSDGPPGGKSSVERIVEWLSVQGNYTLWRGPSQSKKSQAESIAEWLESKGCPGRNGKGVEQQIARLERSFWDAMAYRLATGQGILDNATQQQQMESDDEDAIDHVGLANSKVVAKIREICPFYNSLEPVMAERPSAAPTYLSEQTEADIDNDITCALGFDRNEEQSNTADPGKRPLRRESPDWDDYPALWDTPESQQLPSLTQSTQDTAPPSAAEIPGSALSQPATSTTTSDSSTTSSAQKRSLENSSLTSPRKKSHAETITDCIFPSKEQMDKDRAGSLVLAQRRANTESQLVEATTAIARSLAGADEGSEREKVALAKTNLELKITEFDFKQREDNLETNKRRENIKFNLDIARAQAEVEERAAATRNTNALMQANMIQGFMNSTGFTYEAAVKATNDLMGPLQTVTVNSNSAYRLVDVLESPDSPTANNNSNSTEAA
ncbi:hypothetical protein Pst134EA_019715 [Puccinia striiformis f. sp. tritici]|nr:hypothetical protein Pst134EA_019715 [Puccinia striiformis f. sp. tritici]KAH9459570.1 hypothetical protein Pst134EA_019715 [Puccinia striiformis f. sp. tritici]